MEKIFSNILTLYYKTSTSLQYSGSSQHCHPQSDCLCLTPGHDCQFARLGKRVEEAPSTAHTPSSPCLRNSLGSLSVFGFVWDLSNYNFLEAKMTNQSEIQREQAVSPPVCSCSCSASGHDRPGGNLKAVAFKALGEGNWSFRQLFVPLLMCSEFRLGTWVVNYCQNLFLHPILIKTKRCVSITITKLGTQFHSIIIISIEFS